jgi:hypothetical protein
MKGAIMNNSEQSNGWIFYPAAPGYYRAVSFESPLGQRILNDLAIRYPSFKPKYIQQDHIYDDLPHDMVSADAFGHEDTFEYIVDNGVPRPEEHLNDIASVTYTLTGDLLTFSRGYTYYDFAKSTNLSKMRHDLVEFSEFYEKLKQSAPDVIAMIEHHATIYEKLIAEYNGTYEPLLLRQLLWNFAKILVGN